MRTVSITMQQSDGTVTQMKGLCNDIMQNEDGSLNFTARFTAAGTAKNTSLVLMMTVGAEETNAIPRGQNDTGRPGRTDN